MSRIKTGWRLSIKSWRLLRSHPAMVRFPLLGGLAAIPAGALAVAGIVLIDTHEYAAGIAALAVGTYCSTFVIAFFGVALAACADEILHDRPADSSTGFAVARSRLGSIAGWSLISATVGLGLQAIEAFGKGGEIVEALVGAAWSLVTFLVLPVLAIEGVGPTTAIKDSAATLKKRWVEGLAGIPMVGLPVFVFAILPALAITILGFVMWLSDGNGAEQATGGTLVALGIILLVVAGLVQSSIRGIFGVVLFRYAADDETLGGFSAEEIEASVRRKH